MQNVGSKLISAKTLHEFLDTLLGLVYRCLLDLYRDRLHAQLLELFVDILDPPLSLGLVDDAGIQKTLDVLSVILCVMVAL